MKTAIILTGMLLIAQIVWTQNVGIGTNTPAFKLDVRGGSINCDAVYRIAGSPVLSAGTLGAINYTFVGVDCGVSNIGYFNTGTGYRALYSNTSGSYNTAHGAFALYSNITGRDNTAIGANALLSNTFGLFNTANGSGALKFNSEGSYNTATGHQALYSNSTGSSNTASGDLALYGNTIGSYNTAIGAEAMYSASTGSYNTALGYTALYSAGSGSYNTALGTGALSLNAAGNFNTAIGYVALHATSNSSYNMAIGYRAGHTYNLGWNNTLIGTETNVSFDGQYNSIAIGNSVTCPDNSTVRIGNPANWSYGGYANWTNISDGRYKTNVQENVPGLNFIMKLRPVTYQMDVQGLFRKLSPNAEELSERFAEAIAQKEQMIWTGFVAQEVEAAAQQTGFNFSGVDKPRNEYGVYGLRYAEFVVPLVKAVQEQQQMIEAIRKEIAQLKEEQNKLLMKD